MSATGIGAAVRRKEDQRFITGKGHYTDDVNRPGQAYAYFLRSPHAHAKIKKIDGKTAATMPGVLAILSGAELAADKIGNLICGWMIHSKDGSQMKMAPHPAIALGMAPEHKLRVIAPDVGGGFGSKIFIYPEEVVCLWAARRIGRPVKWVSDRSEAFLADAHGRDHVTHAEMAFDDEQRIIGLRVKTIANLGAYMSTFSS